MLHKALSSIEEVPYCSWMWSVIFQGHTAKNQFWLKLGFSGLKNLRFESILSKIIRPVAAIKSLRFALFFSCDQAALWMVFSVRLSVCPSVCPSVRPSHLFDYVPFNVSSWNFQELLPMTKVTSMQKVKVRGQKSRSQGSRPNLTVSGL